MTKVWKVENLVLLILALVPIGLVFAPFLLSICMISMAVVAVFALDIQKAPFVQWRVTTIRNFAGFFQRPDYYLLTGIFLLTFWGFWAIEDTDYWLSRFRIKLPFLILPFAFYFAPRPSRKALLGLFSFFLLVLSMTSIGVLINYWYDFEAINIAIKQGRSIPLPCNHIRFSMMLVLGVFASGYLYLEGYTLFSQRERPLYLLISVFLFLFLHILSVRTGLAVLYGALACLILQYIIRTRKVLLGIFLMMAMVAIPFVAYKTLPSLKNKIDYFSYDLYMYRHGDQGENLSDAGRITSLLIGWEVFQKAPIQGVGVGDLKKEVMSIYDRDYAQFAIEGRRMPHNQLLSILASSGLLGLLIFLSCFFYPLLYKKAYQHWLFLGFYCIIFLSFMVENTIENAMGVGFTLFYLLLMKWLIDHSNSEYAGDK